MGAQQEAEASIQGDALPVAMGGHWLRFDRAAEA
jgi:hypothetical protein